MSWQVTLLILTGSRAGESVTVPSSGASLGRSKLSDIPIDDGLLSRIHCRISPTEEGVTLRDLESSNGTLLNGVAVEGGPKALQDGDVITVGNTALRVSLTQTQGVAPTPPTPPPVEPPAVPTAVLDQTPGFSINLSQVPPVATPPPPPQPEVPQSVPPQLFPEGTPTEVPKEVDLGLDVAKGEGAPKKSPLRGLIIALSAVLLLALGAGAISYLLRPQEQPIAPRRLAATETLPFAFAYEHLRIDADTLYRYTLTYENSGKLTLSSVDLGDADRSFTKSEQLSEQAQAALRKELVNARYTEIGQIYPEESADGISLNRKKLTIIFGTSIWSRTAENTSARAFDTLCERLETFARLELGVVATQYSVAELEAMAEEQLNLAKHYWTQRDLGDEKLYRAVEAYEKGIAFLLTLNPKPAFAAELTEGLVEAETLLGQRYEDASFEVEQALVTKRYEDAEAMLQKILRMLPNRDDERNFKATEKLLSVEKFMMKGGR